MKPLFLRCLMIIFFVDSYTYADSLNIITVQPLSFGSFVAGGGGNIVMSPLGARTNTGTTMLLSSDPGAPAQFFVTSNKNNNYSITFSSAINLTGPGGSMQLNQFTSSPTSGNTGASGQTLSVGGTLRVNSNQTPGGYSGSFVVTVNLN